MFHLLDPLDDLRLTRLHVDPYVNGIIDRAVYADYKKRPATKVHSWLLIWKQGIHNHQRYATFSGALAGLIQSQGNSRIQVNLHPLLQFI